MNNEVPAAAEPDLLEVYDAARDELIRAVEQYVRLDAADDDVAGASWAVDLADDEVALAALRLVRAVESLDVHDQPVGWPGREHIY